MARPWGRIACEARCYGVTVFASQSYFMRCLHLPSYGLRRLLAIFSLRMSHFTLLFMARDFSLVVRHFLLISWSSAPGVCHCLYYISHNVLNP